MAPPEAADSPVASEAAPTDEAASRASSAGAASETASGDPAPTAASSDGPQRADEQQPEPQPESEAEAEPDHEAQLTVDIEELTARAQKADQYLELAQRTKADFENYRKRAAREASLAQERGIAKLAKELLPAVDNLDRALDAAEAQAAANGGGTATAADGAEDPLVSGIKLVHADVLAALSRAGIERFEPAGERFDPQRHEAVAQQPVDGAEPGTIVEVYQRGYRIGDSVLRPARVLVAG
jgi:molecular chaperone GrpE